MIEELGLHDFRNYTSLRHGFQRGLNIFVGKNGSGKTNLLEAIYFLLHGQSFRNVKPNDLTHNRKGNLGIKLRFKEGEESHTLALTLQNGKKKLLYNNKPLEDINAIRKKLKIIFFSSQDIDLILLSPTRRREFFDGMLAGIKESYREAWGKYRKILQHRNRELAKMKRSTLWDEKLITQGQAIIAMRISFLKAISVPLKKIFFTLSQNSDFNPRITYCCEGEITDTPLTLEAYRERLNHYRERDGYRGFTHFGPHTDDYYFYLQNNLSKTYSSQGENRLFVFALKFALYEYFRKALHKNPLLILDDVFNDFDPERLSLFFKYLGKQKQVLLACANEGLFLPYVDTLPTTIYRVDQGIITPWNSTI